MADEEPDNVMLVDLRRTDAKADRMVDDLHDVKGRLTNLEECQAGLDRRKDRLETRVERIDLVDRPQ